MKYRLIVYYSLYSTLFLVFRKRREFFENFEDLCNRNENTLVNYTTQKSSISVHKD